MRSRVARHDSAGEEFKDDQRGVPPKSAEPRDTVFAKSWTLYDSRLAILAFIRHAFCRFLDFGLVRAV